MPLQHAAARGIGLCDDASARARLQNAPRGSVDVSVKSPAIQILCVGTLRPPHDAAGREYERRLVHMTGFRCDEVVAEPLQRGEAAARSAEAERMRARLARNAWTVCLDPRGVQPASSAAFAEWLERRLSSGRPVAMMIGGASGIDGELLKSCDEQMSLGPLTMPHQLARVVLTEQLYRALCVLQGHPYPH